MVTVLDKENMSYGNTTTQLKFKKSGEFGWY